MSSRHVAPATKSQPRKSLSVARMMKLSEVIEELDVPKSTFHRWRAIGKGPRSIKLPNGAVRVRRSEFERWLAELEDAA